MNFSGPFIRRPIATLLLSVALTAAGLLAYQSLPVASLPQVDFPSISVAASLPGASPETMANTVATPLIKEFSTIPSLQTISATSAQGSTTVALEFDLDRAIDSAAADVQAAIARAQQRLPAEMTSPPSYRKLNPADAPVLLIALTSDTRPMTELDALVQSVISPRLSTLPGVGQLIAYGNQKYAVRVQLDPNALAARGIGIDEVERAVRAANSNAPVGTIRGSEHQLAIEATTQLGNAAAFRDLIVATPHGRPVRLGEVARVIDSVEDDQRASWYDGARALVLAVQRQPDANTVEVIDRVKGLLPRLQDELGQTVSVKVMNDRSISIREAITDVQITLALTTGAVCLIVYLFVGHLGATLISSSAVPISIVATFAAMYGLGLSLDNITLLALTLAVGLVVDDAIVVMENILRHREEGMPRWEAALTGAREVGFTVLSITASLVAVFIPLLFMDGVVGRILNAFAVTVTASLAVSALVSLTLTPMLAARLPEMQRTPRRSLPRQAFDHVTIGYCRLLDHCLRRRPLVLLGFVVTVIATVWMFRAIPKGFLPQEDIGQLTIATEARQNISFQAMVSLQSRVEDAVLASPHVAHVVSEVGAGGSASMNRGRLFLELTPKEERPPLDQVLSELRRDLARIPGIEALVTTPQNARMSSRQGYGAFHFVVQARTLSELEHWSGRLSEAMRHDPFFLNVTTDLDNTALQATVSIDRDKAQQLGISADQIRSTLYTSFGPRKASTIYDTADGYAVLMQLAPSPGGPADQLNLIKVRASNGTLVPLSTFAKIESTVGLQSINQFGQLPAVTIGFDTPPGIALGEAVNRIDEIKRKENVPTTVSTSFAGAARVFQEALANQTLLLGAAVLTIYIVLGMLYESLVHPLIILAGLPAAAVGALSALELCGMELSVMAFIGILLLIGVVKKNAIMMIDVAIQLQRKGDTPLHAIRQACLLRFRPIMMTTLVAVVAAVPIALGSGAGSELRQPLGVAVLGGLVLSQFLTLFITPVLYLYAEKGSEILRVLRSRALSWQG